MLRDSLSPAEKAFLDIAGKQNSDPYQVQNEWWPTIMSLALQHKMSSLVSDNLGHHVPQPWSRKLKKATAAQALWSARQTHCWKLIREKIRASGLEVVVLKGLRSRQDLYRAPHHRFLSDHDLLIHLEDLDYWERELRALGFQAHSPTDLKTGYHTAFYSPLGVVELHWGFGGGLPATQGWEASVPWECENIRGLSAEDRLLFQLHHAVRHEFGMSMYQYLDIARLLETDWCEDKLVERAQIWSRPKAYQLVSEIAHQLFCLPHSRLPDLHDNRAPDGVAKAAVRIAISGAAQAGTVKRLRSRKALPSPWVDERTLRRHFKLTPEQEVTAWHQIKYSKSRLSSFITDLKFKAGHAKVVKNERMVLDWLKHEAPPK